MRPGEAFPPGPLPEAPAYDQSAVKRDPVRDRHYGMTCPPDCPRHPQEDLPKKDAEAEEENLAPLVRLSISFEKIQLWQAKEIAHMVLRQPGLPIIEIGDVL